MDQVLLYGNQHGTIFQLPEYRVLGCTTAGRCEVLAGTNICLVSCSGNSRKEQGKSSKESCLQIHGYQRRKTYGRWRAFDLCIFKSISMGQQKAGETTGRRTPCPGISTCFMSVVAKKLLGIWLNTQLIFYETTSQQLSCTHLVSTVSYSFEYTPTSM